MHLILDNKYCCYDFIILFFSQKSQLLINNEGSVPLMRNVL